jgi:hypothetical protein
MIAPHAQLALTRPRFVPASPVGFGSPGLVGVGVYGGFYGNPDAPPVPIPDPLSAPTPPPQKCPRGKLRNNKGRCVPKGKGPVWMVPALVGVGVLALGFAVLALTGKRRPPAAVAAMPAVSAAGVSW